jgi:hypothetical protein
LRLIDASISTNEVSHNDEVGGSSPPFAPHSIIKLSSAMSKVRILPLLPNLKLITSLTRLNCYFVILVMIVVR